MARRRRRRRRHGSTLRLTAILLVLVGINVYVFFYSPGSLKKVSQAAQAASVGAPAEAPPVPPAPPAVGKKKDGAVREREGLGAVLRREGLAPVDADAVLRAFQPIMDFKKEIHGGQRYSLRLAADGRLDAFELRGGAGVVYAAVREDGKLVGKKTGPAAKPEPTPSVSRRSGSARAASGTP